jgi:hypothetical protein
VLLLSGDVFAEENENLRLILTQHAATGFVQVSFFFFPPTLRNVEE